MNRAPGAEQHDHKRHKHHGIVAFSGREPEKRPQGAAAAETPALPKAISSFRSNGTPATGGPSGATPTTTSASTTPRATATPRPKATATPTKDATTHPGPNDPMADLPSFRYSVRWDLSGSVIGSYLESIDSWSIAFYLLKDTNVPTRMVVKAVGSDENEDPAKLSFQMDVTDFGSKSLKVELPK